MLVIELHARFLEMNFLHQIRALPNPTYSGPSQSKHPLTLHLTPTSTANVMVSAIEPTQPSTQAFVKISPEAEVIVAPKARQHQSVQDGNRESRSVTSRRSAGGKSTASAMRERKSKDDSNARSPVFLRAVDRTVAEEWFDDDASGSHDDGLCVWVDSEVLQSATLKGITWVTVSLVRPVGLEEPRSPQNATPEQDLPSDRIVARLQAWDDALDSQHAAMSTMLCASLAAKGIVGGIVRIEAAPHQMPKTVSAMKQPSKDGPKEVIVRALKISPFLTDPAKQASSISFGGETTAEQERSAQRLRSLFKGSHEGEGLLDGPLTHGMVLPADSSQGHDQAWPGGILRFDPAPAPNPTSMAGKGQAHWFIGSERKLALEVQPAVARPSELGRLGPGQDLPDLPPALVGIDALLNQVQRNLLHSASILLTGGLGSGKTSVTHRLLHTLKRQHLFNVTYLACRTLTTDETRVSTIKETLERTFGLAAWGARLGGQSIVVLDDLDKLCPAEQELQVGGESERTRHLSELTCSIARKYCSKETGVVLLATAQSKESVNNLLIGAHVVRDIVSLKAPNKEGRRKVLEHLCYQKKQASALIGPVPAEKNGLDLDGHAWMDNSDSERPSSSQSDSNFGLGDGLDLLDIAGQTDGYMPGDLSLLVSRARSEALIRTFSGNDDVADVLLSGTDFAAALKGFTPASLRNVTLQSSTTTFSSIGGLRETRQTLLETLQYPTTYAPIFAKCPLRLRSGLLLYGYPGCGKTMLASAVAGECGLNFISVKGPEILNKYIGASEKSVRDLFERAEAARPCVLFFDEFDSIAPKRGHDSTGVTDRVVNQLLTQMDGAEGLSGVYVLAATSRPDMIDPALLRPGRLDKSLLCDMPTTNDRLDILRAVSGKLKLETALLNGQRGESLDEIARQTEGYSGADLQAVMYNAHLEAIHDLLGSSDGTEDKQNRSGGEQDRGTARHHNFTFFRYGDSGVPKPDPTALSPGSLAERAGIAAKLAQMDQARKRSKQQRHAGPQDRATSRNRHDGADVKEPEGEPTISWKHVLKSLETTRPSIARDEQRRLQAIYREFVVGRNGEMPNGQGGNEIGGRTSLM